MKVGTDSILLGSWVQTNSAQHILDIGTGSGLLAIMLAQKSQHTCLIDGIDIDACGNLAQAEGNGKNCPWADAADISDIQAYSTISNVEPWL